MSLHPDALELVDLVRDGIRSETARTVHRHCLVCDDCHSMLQAVILLREGYARPTASLSLPAAAAAVQ